MPKPKEREIISLPQPPTCELPLTPSKSRLSTEEINRELDDLLKDDELSKTRQATKKVLSSANKDVKNENSEK